MPTVTHNARHWDAGGDESYEDYDSFVGKEGEGWRLRIWRSLIEGDKPNWLLTLGPEHTSTFRVLMRDGVGSANSDDTMGLSDAAAQRLLMCAPEDALLHYYGRKPRSVTGAGRDG